MSKKEFRTWLQTVDLSKVTASERESFRAALRACVDPKANNLNVAMDTKVSGPVYTEWESDNGMKHYVHGRVLRQYQSVQSVGVSGFVLSAETGANAKKDAQSRALAQFQVDQLYWDRRGRAHGTLTEVTRFTQEQRRHKDAVEKNVRPVSPKDRFRIQELMANARKSV
ncbi:hypothetical protein BCR44DRAFT_41025 [Catenaria anguillulae PL171]|uniref:Uncharacterized protein n=1 Tax=Catenaria anguillulae PL171 TaxID=765915 RepID=A0A1Y2I7C2_9FUNG|nr:hypothetical protein BCR44DRAFT_41025 [Catenaria anguillulae PL171]